MHIQTTSSGISFWVSYTAWIKTREYQHAQCLLSTNIGIFMLGLFNKVQLFNSQVCVLTTSAESMCGPLSYIPITSVKW